MRVILVATPRSGSMSIYRNLQTRYSLENNFLEIFNPGPARKEKENWKGKDTHSRVNRIKFIIKQWEKWSNSENSMAKIDLHQIYRKVPKEVANEILDDMLTKCDKIFYCYRRNTAEQITSFALARKAREWRRDNRETLLDISKEEFNWCGETLLFRYEQLIDLLEKYPGQVLCMEDVLDHKPYKNRPETRFMYTWDNIEDLITRSVSK